MPKTRQNLIEFIKYEHVRLAGRIKLLSQEVENWASGAETDFDLLQQLVRFFSLFPDEIHHKKEDVIYDALVKAGVSESDYLRRLKDEHARMAALKSQFAEDLEKLLRSRGAPDEALAESIRQYISVQELHMAEEESQFLPLANRELSDETFSEIGNRIQAELIDSSSTRLFADLADIDAKIDARLKARPN